MIGYCYRCEICPYCGAQFHCNGSSFESELKAMEEKKDHLSVCLVRFEREEPSKEWKAVLDRTHRMIEICEKEVEELKDGLKTKTIPSPLISTAKDIIEKRKREIADLQESIGEPYFDYEYHDIMIEGLEEDLVEALKEEFKKELIKDLLSGEELY